MEVVVVSERLARELTQTSLASVMQLDFASPTVSSSGLPLPTRTPGWYVQHCYNPH